MTSQSLRFPIGLSEGRQRFFLKLKAIARHPNRRKVRASALLALAVVLVTLPFLYFSKPLSHKGIIYKYAAIYDFDPLFAMALVKVESEFQRDALSHRGAIGLMQLMPDTAMEMAKRVGRTVTLADLQTPEINIHLGFHYLSLLRKEFNGDLIAVVAAYNAGPSHVRAWQKKGPLTPDNIPFWETKLSVKRVMRNYRWLKRIQKVKHAFRVTPQKP